PAARLAGRGRPEAPGGARPPRRREATEAVSVETVASEIERLADATGGIVGVSATQLATGRHLGYREDQLFPTASVIKLPLIVTLYEDALAGRIDLARS